VAAAFSHPHLQANPTEIRSRVRRTSPCARRARKGLAALQAPQSARREDDGEDRGNAERDECPDDEESSAGLGDLAADSRPLMWSPCL
jgi:hypothetical protein